MKFMVSIQGNGLVQVKDGGCHHGIGRQGGRRKLGVVGPLAYLEELRNGLRIFGEDFPEDSLSERPCIVGGRTGEIGFYLNGQPLDLGWSAVEIDGSAADVKTAAFGGAGYPFAHPRFFWLHPRRNVLHQNGAFFLSKRISDLCAEIRTVDGIDLPEIMTVDSTNM